MTPKPANKIRPAKPQESDRLSALAFRSKVYWGYPQEFMNACRAELTYTADDIRDHHFFVILNDDRPVGFYGLTRLAAIEIELEALFVEPEYIGKGYGRALIEHAKTVAKQLGGSELIIQGDPNAAQFYLRAGGKLIGERESASIPGRYLPVFSVYLDDT